MEIILTSLIIGMLVGRIANQKIHTVNDKVFTILSTILVLVMGVSLGVNRALFFEAQSLFIDSVISVVIFSLGSIFGVLLLTKLLNNSNV